MAGDLKKAMKDGKPIIIEVQLTFSFYAGCQLDCIIKTLSINKYFFAVNSVLYNILPSAKIHTKPYIKWSYDVISWGINRVSWTILLEFDAWHGLI